MRKFFSVAAIATLAFSASAHSAGVVYDDKSEFLAAAGETTLEDFNDETLGSSFNTMSLEVGDFSLLRTPDYPYPNRNIIDIYPTNFDVDGTQFAHVLTTAGSSLFLNFKFGITSFATDFDDFNNFGGGKTLIVINGETFDFIPRFYDNRGFFGYTSETAFTSIEFRGLTNDGFAMDNVLYTASTAVPVPAAVWLFGSALAGLGWMRRKKSS